MAVVLSLMTSSFTFAAAPTDSAPIAQTQYGEVRGSAEDEMLAFKGIRYGADTATRRFQRALPPATWQGVKDAQSYGESCPQMKMGSLGLFSTPQVEPPQSEDCLFLNVWTPSLDDGKKRPVMVWFHGGGYVTGSGSSSIYDGTRLAKRGDIVVVTVNHRLNALGYLYLAGLTKDPRYADSGNIGSLDMVQFLEWVRDNIGLAENRHIVRAAAEVLRGSREGLDYARIPAGERAFPQGYRGERLDVRTRIHRRRSHRGRYRSADRRWAEA
jgi:para-nitrobenzyl esterase